MRSGIIRGTGDSVLAVKPGAEINQPATLAAEREANRPLRQLEGNDPAAVGATHGADLVHRTGC